MREYIASGRPYFGICIGMQVLFQSSAENPDRKGLGLIPSPIDSFVNTDKAVPHMGWNTVTWRGGGPGAAATAGALATNGAEATAGASRVLLAMGFSPEEATAGLRLSVGPWLREEVLARVPAALAEAIAEVDAALSR